jgi:hypothetical protein
LNHYGISKETSEDKDQQAQAAEAITGEPPQEAHLAEIGRFVGSVKRLFSPAPPLSGGAVLRY